MKSKKNIGKFIAEPKPAAKASGRATITATTTTAAAKGKVNGVKTNGVNGGQKTIGKEIKKEVEQENEEGRERGVFAIPAPKAPLSARLNTQGFMNGVRFALIGYSEAALLGIHLLLLLSLFSPSLPLPSLLPPSSLPS